MPKFRLLLVGDEDELAIADEVTARELSARQGTPVTLDDLAEMGGTLVTFDMHSPTWRLQQQITSKALKGSQDRGFELDAQAITMAKASLSMKCWPKELAPFVSPKVEKLLGSEDAEDIAAAFEGFPAILCASIVAWIDRKTYPNIADQPDFSKLWSDRPQSSGALR